MTRETWELDALARRVESLERQNRRLRLFGTGLLGAAWGVALVGWSPAGRAEDRSKNDDREMVLKDRDGKQRAKLTMLDGQPGLVFYGADETARAELRLVEKGIVIRYVERGRLRTGLGIGDDGVAL